MGRLRGGAVLAGFAALTVPLLPVQAALLRVSPRWARRFPHWYHRQVCRLLGVRLHVEGAVPAAAPVLLVSNHTSWLDIPVLSAVAPVSFVAKAEVSGWPGVGTLARLQRTVFVDRERRAKVAETAGEIMQRLGIGDHVVLFAEGTSSDGNRVLPFRSSLFAAVKPSRAVVGSASAAGDGSADAAGARHAVPFVQTVGLVYTHLHGVPLGREARALVGWYGDMEMLGHAWRLLQAGPLDVTIRLSEPVPLDAYADRKQLAGSSETAVRQAVMGVLRGWSAREPHEVTQPDAEARGVVRPAAVGRARRGGSFT